MDQVKPVSVSDDGALNGPDAAARARLMRLATYASVSIASILIVAKLWAWLITDSVSLMSTLIDSLLDVAASLINLFAVRHALQPADREHRFGHGKAESLAGLAQAAFIVGSAVFLLIEAAKRVAHPRAIAHPELGSAVMIFAVVLTVLLVAFQRHVVKRTNSVAIKADSLHYQTDVLINASVLASLFMVSEWGWSSADPFIAIGIAAYIIHAAWTIGRDSVAILMDRELPDADRRRISEIARAQVGVLGVHDLRTRSSGNQVFIQMHVEMPRDISLRDAHVIADRVEIRVAEAFPDAEVLVHQDPEGVDEEIRKFE